MTYSETYPIVPGLSDTLVIDSVLHAYNLTAENHAGSPVAETLTTYFYPVHESMQPLGDSRYQVPREHFHFALDPQWLAHAIFAESQNDMAIYHSTPLYGFYKDGLSPFWVGREMHKAYPDRVMISAALSPWQPDVLETVDRLAEEPGVVSFKLYPEDIVDGQIKPWRADDPERLFPIFERIRDRGIKTVAIHKAQPLGPVNPRPFRTDDVTEAALAFPDLTFEIVHGGYAFLEETAMQYGLFSNIVINLESTTPFLLRRPRKFLEILGTLMLKGGASRIVWGTGAMLHHPQPHLAAFWNAEMPDDLMEGYGFPQLTEEAKRGILGLNQARILGIDPVAVKAKLASDMVGGARTVLRPPWSHPYAPPLTPDAAARVGKP